MVQKILIVDDDMYLRELYHEVLQDAGYTVDIAIDGAEGLEKIKQGGYNLILLDVVMPKMDGLGVLTTLSQLPQKPENGPIVLLTNLAHDPIIQEALNKGAKTYLIKTDMTPDQVIEQVKKNIATTPTTQAPQQMA